MYKIIAKQITDLKKFFASITLKGCMEIFRKVKVSAKRSFIFTMATEIETHYYAYTHFTAYTWVIYEKYCNVQFLQGSLVWLIRKNP